VSADRAPWWRVLLTPGGWLTLGVLVRLAHLLTLGQDPLFGDAAEYEQIALRILHGQPLGEASPRAPVYPLFLALGFWIGGEENYLAPRLLQLGLVLVQMLLVHKLATRLGGPAAAGFAAPLVAFTPTLVFVTGLLYPTTLYATLLLAVTWLAWELAERPGVLRAAALGALMVIGWLTDLIFLAPALAVGVWLLVAASRRRGPLLAALAVTAVTGLVLAVPYLGAMRAQRSDRIFLGKAQAVLHFARTDSLISRPRWIRMPMGTPFIPLPVRAFVAREAGLFRASPVAYAHDVVFEFFHFFQPLPDRVTTRNRFNTPWVLWVGAAWFALLLPLAVLGVFRGAAPLSGRLLLAAIVFATAGFYAFFFSQTRYRIPVEPQLLLLASLALATAFPRLGRLWADTAESRP